MDHRQERLKESLLILEGLDPVQRRAWIRERLADEPDLAREAARLMDVEVDATDRLTPLVEPPPGLSIGGVLPKTIGPFVVEGLIAQGGMGNVYRAHQQVPMRRRAAVKVLRAEVSSSQLFARFEDERQAIAKMEHRNVARLLDAGTDAQGVSYIAMELVDGPPITEYAVLHRLSLRARLELFVQVCRGVQHAHNRGILHRDIKPSNILVADEDAQPVPKIIDFGVAKLFASESRRVEHTLIGQLVGTLGYMSPEQTDQLHPDADVRSDVYSLGVVLYELLTGVLPVPSDLLLAAGIANVRSIVLNHPRTAPSRVVEHAESGRGVPGGFPSDVDCLVLKAAHPDPQQRYASPSELAADIERYLSGRPILARPPSTWYQTQKFVQRHKLPVITGSLVLAAILSGLFASAIGFRQAVLQRRNAESALAETRLEKQRADEALARSEEVSKYLRELLMRAHPAKLGPRATFEQILDAAAADFLQEPPTDVFVRAEVANALAEPLYLTGDYETVERLVLPQIDSLSTQSSKRAAELRVAMMLRLGYVASRKSQPKEAERRFTQAADFARDSGIPQLVYQSSGALAQTYSADGQYDRAIEMLHAMLETEVAKSNELLRASALSNLGTAYGRKGAAAQGLPYSRDGYEIRTRLAPRDPNTHNMGWQLGISYMENGHLDQSVEVLQQTYAASAAASGVNHPDVVAGAVLLHYAKARRGDGASVIPPMRDAIEKQREIGVPLPQVAQSRMYLAGALMYVGDRAEAVREADATLAELAQSNDPCSRAVVTVLLQVGTMFSASKAETESLVYLKRAFECTKTSEAAAPFAPRIVAAIVWSYRRMQDQKNEEAWLLIEANIRNSATR